MVMGLRLCSLSSVQGGDGHATIVMLVRRCMREKAGMPIDACQKNGTRWQGMLAEVAGGAGARVEVAPNCCCVTRAIMHRNVLVLVTAPASATPADGRTTLLDMGKSQVAL